MTAFALAGVALSTTYTGRYRIVGEPDWLPIVGTSLLSCGDELPLRWDTPHLPGCPVL